MKKNWKETLKLWLGALLLLAESATIGCKKLSKKAVALCVAAALVVAMVPAYVFAAETTYDIWVGGVQVTSANKDDIVKAINDAANATPATGTATYDPDTKTLTLNNFSYTGLGYNHNYYYYEDYGEHYYSYAAIYSKNKLIIKLVGNNTVFCEGEGAGLPSFCGVYTEEYGDLTICDDTTDNAIGSFSANRISSYGNLTIRDVNVTTMGQLNVLYSAKDLLIQKATVSAVADSNAITCSGNMTIENHSIVTATATDNGNDDDRGIYHLGTLTIKNSSLEIISGRKASGSFNENNLIPYLYFEGPYIVLAGEDKASAAAAASAEAATYTAKYVKIAPTYKITVNYGIDGIDNKETTVAMGDTISLETPVLAGYVFMGWYADADFTTAFDFDTPITAATTIYAKLADYEGDKTELNNKINAAKADLQGKIDAVNSALAGKADAADVNAAIANLQAAIAALEAVKDDYATADTALKTELEGKIADAQTAAISAAETLVNNAKTELQSKIDAKANTADVNAAIANLQASIAALEAVKDDYATADATLKTELEGKIADAQTAAISAAETLVNNAKTELQSKIDAKANTADVNAAIANLQASIAALEAVKDDYATADATLKTELEGKIADAQTAAISAAETLVNNAKTELQSKIDAKADAATTTVAIQNLQAAVAALEAVKDDYATADATLKTELEGKISAAQTATISAAETLVNNAKTELQSKIDAKADAATTTVAIQNLQAAVAALEAVKDDYATADATLKTELEGKISAAQTATISAAETLVNNAKAELTAAINNKADTATLNAKINELNTAIATAEATAKAYTDNAAATLTTAIATAKSEAISAAETLVNTAKAELQSAIDTKADAATVNVAIANLQNAITALENAKDNYVSADAALKAELEAAIAKAKQEAIDAAKGHIPYIGTNGNWWIGDTDTGVDANGIKGDTGNGIASITTKKENGVTTVTITFTDPQKEPVVFTISDGATGATGADGVGVAKVEKTATNGKVDTYTITLTNGTTYTFTVTNGKDGANGMDGENGKDGADGKDGLTPFIGENGNWWIGENDTGVKAAADDSVPVGSGNVTEAEGVNTVTIVAIVIAGVALLGNVLLAVLVLKKKKSLV